MPNPIFNALGGGPVSGIMQQINQFRARFASGFNPQQYVMNMVNSGQLTQQQLDYAQQMAQQVQRQMGGQS